MVWVEGIEPYLLLFWLSFRIQQIAIIAYFTRFFDYLSRITFSCIVSIFLTYATQNTTQPHNIFILRQKI